MNRPGVTWSVERGIAAVTMEREHANAINGDLLEGLMQALQAAEADSAAKALLLRAEGKLFSPGLDLQELLPLRRPEMERFMSRFDAAVVALYTFPKPMVAAVHGHALAGGCILALTADWRVLRRGAMVGLNEVKVGVPLPFGVAQILRDTVHTNRLTEIALLGRNYRDEEAVDAGLANELADAASFEQVCRARLEEFTAKDVAAFGTTKRYLRSAVVERIRAHGSVLMKEFLDGWYSAPTQTRIAEIVAGLTRKP